MCTAQRSAGPLCSAPSQHRARNTQRTGAAPSTVPSQHTAQPPGSAAQHSTAKVKRSTARRSTANAQRIAAQRGTAKAQPLRRSAIAVQVTASAQTAHSTLRILRIAHAMITQHRHSTELTAYSAEHFTEQQRAHTTQQRRSAKHSSRAQPTAQRSDPQHTAVQSTQRCPSHDTAWHTTYQTTVHETQHNTDTAAHRAQHRNSTMQQRRRSTQCIKCADLRCDSAVHDTNAVSSMFCGHIMQMAPSCHLQPQSNLSYS